MKRPADMGSLSDARPFSQLLYAMAWVMDKYPNQPLIAEMFFDMVNLHDDPRYKSDFYYGVDRYGRPIHKMYFNEKAN